MTHAHLGTQVSSLTLVIGNNRIERDNSTFVRTRIFVGLEMLKCIVTAHLCTEIMSDYTGSLCIHLFPSAHTGFTKEYAGT